MNQTQFNLAEDFSIKWFCFFLMADKNFQDIYWLKLVAGLMV